MRKVVLKGLGGFACCPTGNAGQQIEGHQAGGCCEEGGARAPIQNCQPYIESQPVTAAAARFSKQNNLFGLCFPSLFEELVQVPTTVERKEVA